MTRSALKQTGCLGFPFGNSPVGRSFTVQPVTTSPWTYSTGGESFSDSISWLNPSFIEITCLRISSRARGETGWLIQRDPRPFATHEQLGYSCNGVWSVTLIEERLAVGMSRDSPSC